MTFRVAGVFVLVLVLAYCCMAIVDTYKYHYEISKDTLQEIRDSVDSYFEEKMKLLDSYTGPKAESCKEKLDSEPGAIGVILQTTMIQATGQVQSIDTKIYEEVTKCYGDQCCIDKAMAEGVSVLEAFKVFKIQQNKEITDKNLKDVKEFMDSCTGE